MSVNIRYPQISGNTDREQLTQIKSYLHQLVEQLNWALPNLGAGSGSTQTGEANGGDTAYYELRSMVITKIQEIENMVDAIEAGYVKNAGWPGDRYLATDATGKVIAGKLTFTLDEDGNLYYELEE